jgi:hypothetical protein
MSPGLARMQAAMNSFRKYLERGVPCAKFLAAPSTTLRAGINGGCSHTVESHAARLKRPRRKSKKQIPRRLKSPRNDKN